MTTISVIVPVYNAEKYLPHCIDSILAQTFTDFEVLLIDDGSTDNSGKICDEYAVKDSRIRVFHKKNGGVSSARNLGIKEAHGDWITFIDSDDWIYPNLLNDYYKYFPNHADLYIQGFIDSNKNKSVDKEQYWKGNNLIIETDKLEKQLIGFVWNKLFKSSIIKDHQLFFDEKITMIEDLLFVYHYMICSESVLNIPRTNYYYWRHETSACFKKHSFESWDRLIDQFYGFMMQFHKEHKDFTNKKLKIFYELSLDVLRSLYIDNINMNIRIPYLKKLKDRAKQNTLIQVSSMNTLNNNVITGMILYLPAALTDKLLLAANKIISVKR